MIRSRKLPKDPNRRAAEIVRLSTEDAAEEVDPVSAYLAEIGRKGGLKGGKARADALSASKRKAIAKKAAKARWGNAK
ncbi:MAG: histone H1 [Acidobacteria bacterium]|nr:MAG: histone H1 [Acidobacteriota bacterium]